MKIANDPALITFSERSGDGEAGRAAEPGCRCVHCEGFSAARGRAGRAARADRSDPRARLPVALRSTCVAGAVLAGAGVIGLSTGAQTASAEAAPGHAGWDGVKYWFKNSAGAWRWTSHGDVYLARTSGSAAGAGTAGPAGAKPTAARPTAAVKPPAAKGTPSSGGVQQGWDGSRYWFRGVDGSWHWTTHRDIYLARTGGRGGVVTGGGTSGGPASGSAGSAAGGSAKPAPAPAGAATRPTTTAPAPAAADAGPDDAEAAIDFALAQVGKPYIWGGNGPTGYDCSGLVQQAYRRSDISLPRVADDQYVATTPIDAEQLRRGDLLFWSDSERASGIHHVAVYLGNNQYVEAPRPGKSIRVSTLSAAYYPTHFGRP